MNDKTRPQSIVDSPQSKAKNTRVGLITLAVVCGLWSVVSFSSCTVKAVGDPNRPIMIKAHVIVDIRGLKETAANIEDYVSGETEELKTESKKS